ncbi:hypothetical protein BH20ACI3_BH20ACI3_05360 [soil metagenome]
MHTLRIQIEFDHLEALIDRILPRDRLPIALGLIQ